MRIEAFHACLIRVKTLSNDSNSQKGGVVKFHTCCGGAADTLPRGSALAQVPLLPISGVPYQFPSPPGSKLFGMKVSLWWVICNIIERILFKRLVTLTSTAELYFQSCSSRFISCIGWFTSGNCTFEKILCSLDLRNNLYYDVSIAGEVPEETVFLQASDE